MHDFFISYTNSDKDWAEWIAWQLEQADYEVVLSAWDFFPGQNFILEMQRASSNCKKTIVVLSEDFLQSLYTQPEWSAAFASDPNGRSRKLIPVRVKPCRLEGLLRSIIYIDLLDRNESQARVELLAGVSGLRLKPESPPGFPRGPVNSDWSAALYPGVNTPPPNFIEDRHEGREFLVDQFGRFVVQRLDNKTPGYLFLIDIDGMTGINKKFGSDLGDIVIKEILALLKLARGTEYSGRCGDDTFYAVMIDKTERQAKMWANKLLKKIRSHNWSSFGHDLYITCSIGFVSFDRSKDSQEIVFRAVKGYYMAKEDGGNKANIGPSFLPSKQKPFMWQNDMT